MASDVEFDVVLVDGGNLRLQGGRAASPMVELLKTMAKNGFRFRLQRGTGDQGGKTQ
jgi:hypothetical protein